MDTQHNLVYDDRRNIWLLFTRPTIRGATDRDRNEKFGQKLDYLTGMRDLFHAERPARSILVGDLNIAPREDDVWNHKQLLKVVSHTPVETETLNTIRDRRNWVDLVRKHVPPFVKAAREPLSYAGVNVIGLQRRGFSPEQINHIQDIYRIMFVKGYKVTNALAIIEQEIKKSNDRDRIVSFVEASIKNEIGIMKGFRHINGSKVKNEERSVKDED